MTSKQDIRLSVLTLLKLLSSKEQQRQYHQQFPSANVALELLCKWFDELYNQSSPLFKLSFTADEFTLIQEFNRYYGLRKGKLPETIEQLHLDSDWNVIMDEAQYVLDGLQKNNK